MYNKILVPIDLGNKNLAENVVAKAINIASINDAELHILSIFPDFGNAWVADHFSRQHQEEAMSKLGEDLVAFVHENCSDGINAHPHIVHGSVYEEIIHAADKLICDLIVMGSHRPELSDYLLGPNAARVVRHAKASVLVVRN